MNWILAAEGAEGGSNVLLPPTYELVIGTIAFLVIFFALSKFALPNIRKTLEQRTETIEGVAKEHIPFIKAACELLKSGSRGGYGNLCDGESTDELLGALDDLISQYPDRPEYCESGGEVFEGLLYDLGFGSSEWYVTRVFDGMKIEYVPTDIVVQDVTDEF